MKRLFRLYLLVALAFAGATEAATIGQLQLDSEPGDPIGTGANVLLDIDAANMSASAIDNRLQLSYFSSVPRVYWTLTLASPKYPNPPGVGCHERAHRDTFVPARPGLDFGFAHVGCNAVLGRYRIHELQIHPTTHAIERIAVDFVQHCEGKTPALFGKLRLNSTTPLATEPMQRLFVTQGQLDIVSPPGEPLGGGQNRSIAFDESSFRAWGNYSLASPPPGQLEMYHRERHYPDGYWSLRLTTRNEASLVPGTYDAGDVAFGNPTLPGMTLGLGGYVCGADLRGRFEILEHERDRIDGLSTRFSAALLQQCTARYPALEAQLSYATSFVNGPLADDVMFLDGLDPYKSWPLTWNCQ